MSTTNPVKSSPGAAVTSSGAPTEAERATAGFPAKTSPDVRKAVTQNKMFCML